MGGGQDHTVRQRKFEVGAQLACQEGQGRSQVLYLALLHEGHRLQRRSLAPLERDPLEDFEESQRGHQQVAGRLYGWGKLGDLTSGYRGPGLRPV